jgi:hypothetical protein
MTNRLSRSGIFSRVNEFLFGKALNEQAVAVDALRELMAVESAVRGLPTTQGTAPSHETLAMKDKAVAQKRNEIESVSDENILFLSELLPRFKDGERGQIISDVTSGLTDAETTEYLELLEATSDISNIAPSFDDDTFVNLVKGLENGIRTTGASAEKVRSQKEVLVRFGMVMSLATRHGVTTAPFSHLYKDDSKNLGLVLRDPSLESVLIRNPEHLDKVAQLVISDPTLTGNRIGGIILGEGTPATTYTVSGGSS